jgi:cytochrome c556
MIRIGASANLKTKDQAMNMNLRLAAVLTLAFFALGPSPTLAQPESAEQQSMVAAQMYEQLSRMSTIKSAIVAGRLEDVREPATWLIEHKTVAGFPAEFESYVAQMRSYARQVIEAQDLGSAAGSVSKIAESCGNCHLATDINLAFGYDRKPREDLEDVVTHMQRHQWAADRMWEGLIGPSDSAWNRGTDMLIDAPLPPSDVTTATDNIVEINDIARRIHALGGIGTETTTADARSELYAEVLGLCGSCHTLLGRGPAY